MAEKLFRKFLKTRSPHLLPKYQTFERKHDLADAYTQSAYWCGKKRKEKIQIDNRTKMLRRKTVYNGERILIGDLFEKFKYQEKVQEIN